MPNCPDCNNFLKEGAFHCLCGWRSKPKEPEKPGNCCNKCGDLRAYRCGPDHAPFFLCDLCREKFKKSLESEPDYFNDLVDKKYGQ